MTSPSVTHILQDALAHIPSNVHCVADYAQAARAFIREDIWQHIQQGSDQNLSIATNRQAFDACALLPQVLRSLHQGNAGITLLGERHLAPLLLAPVAYHGLVHPDAELASVRAAVATQTGMVISTLASRRFDDIVQAACQTAQELKRPVPPLWLQLYQQPSRSQTLAVIRAAEAAGLSAIMWTVDAHYKRSTLALPAGVSAVNIDTQAQRKHTSHLLDEVLVYGSSLTEQAPTWEDLQWLRTQTQLPIWVKGVLHPHDAKLAGEWGADGVVVSNHGGRVLDGAVAPLTVLPAVRDAVGEAMPILLDGGVSWGTDVVKALALGANAVMVGRPQLHALAVAGTLGVAHMLHVLRMEWELALAQMGCANATELHRGLVRPAT